MRVRSDDLTDILDSGMETIASGSSDPAEAIELWMFGVLVSFRATDAGSRGLSANLQRFGRLAQASSSATVARYR